MIIFLCFSSLVAFLLRFNLTKVDPGASSSSLAEAVTTKGILRIKFQIYRKIVPPTVHLISFSFDILINIEWGEFTWQKRIWDTNPTKNLKSSFMKDRKVSIQNEVLLGYWKGTRFLCIIYLCFIRWAAWQWSVTWWDAEILPWPRQRLQTLPSHPEMLRLCPTCIGVRWPHIHIILDTFFTYICTMASNGPVVPPPNYLEGPVPVISGNKSIQMIWGRNFVIIQTLFGLRYLSI